MLNGDAEKLKGEVGDLLFVVVNLARHLDVDPETALRYVQPQGWSGALRRSKTVLAAVSKPARGRDACRDGRALGCGEGLKEKSNPSS